MHLNGMGDLTQDVQAYITSVFQQELARDPRAQGLEFYTQAVIDHNMTPEELRADILRNAAPEIAFRTALATNTAPPEATDYQESVWIAAANDAIPEPLADWGVQVPVTTQTASITRAVTDTRTASAAQIAAAQVNQQLERLDAAGTDTTDLRTSFQTLTQEASDETGISKPVLIGAGALALLYLLKR